MKTLFLALALILSGVATAHANPAIQREVFTRVEANGQPTDLVVVVEMDLNRDVMVVQMYHDMCGHFRRPVNGFRCEAMPKLYKVRAVPMARKYTYCGSLYFEGFQDRTAQDPERIEVKIENNRQRLCANYNPAVVIATIDLFDAGTNQITNFLLKADQ